MKTSPPKYEFQQPTSAEDWDAYNEIRRLSLFEERGRYGVYENNHPDEFKAGNYPFLLLFEQVPVATVRIDLIADRRAIMRLVAVHPKHRRRGHGRVLLIHAEGFARAHGCVQVVSNAATEALLFYKEAGYVVSEWDPNEQLLDSIQVMKVL